MADYEIGYGRPPREHQFKPGKSGNPKGRPRGAKGLRTELREELNERVTVTSEGRQRKVSKRRLILMALFAQAAKGSVQAADKLISLIIQAEGLEDDRPHGKPLSETELLILDRFMNADRLEAGEAPDDV